MRRGRRGGKSCLEPPCQEVNSFRPLRPQRLTELTDVCGVCGVTVNSCPVHSCKGHDLLREGTLGFDPDSASDLCNLEEILDFLQAQFIMSKRKGGKGCE